MSLVDNNRKRKLRKEEDEKNVSGTEYAKRLQEQYICTFPFMHSISKSNNADDLFALQDRTDANDDIASLLRTTKRFVGSTKALPSDHLDIQKLSEFTLPEDITTTKEYYEPQSSSPPTRIKYVNFHCSEPLFLVSGRRSQIHLYSIKDAEPICRKIVQLSDFVVHQVDWTSKNTSGI